MDNLFNAIKLYEEEARKEKEQEEQDEKEWNL